MPHYAQLPDGTNLTTNMVDNSRESTNLHARLHERQLFGARKAESEYTSKHKNGACPGSNGYMSRINPDAIASYPLLLGQSPLMKRLHTLIARVAPTHSSVLITGETGTGKEIVARTIHCQSPRQHNSFVDINCSAVPETLFEAELFGHQRGSFTGAVETRRGLFEEASGGTLFLDEVDALSLPCQAKLLRVLQEGYVRRIGGRENIHVNVRVVSATSRDLQRAVAEGTFRSDLLFRLRVMPLYMPNLRERGEEDLQLLAEHFLLSHAERYSLPPRWFSSEALAALVSYQWPGNVRELENAVAYALTVGIDEELGLGDLPPEVLREINVQPDALKGYLHQHLSLAETEHRYILAVLESHGGNRTKTATALGIDLRTLNRKLKQYNTETKH